MFTQLLAPPFPMIYLIIGKSMLVRNKRSLHFTLLHLQLMTLRVTPWTPFPPPLFKYTTRSSLAALAGGEANNVAGPSTIPQSQSNGSREIARNRDGVEVIEIEGISINCCFEKKLK